MTLPPAKLQDVKVRAKLLQAVKVRHTLVRSGGLILGLLGWGWGFGGVGWVTW